MPRIFSVLDSSGRPLLSRVFGEAPSPTFPTVALLSSVAQYASNVGFTLESMVSDSAQTIWQRFGDLLFVLVTSSPLSSEPDLKSLLELVYLGFEMLVGRDLLTAAETDGGSTDTLKRQLRSATALVDALLSEDDTAPSLAFQAPQVAILPEAERAIIGTALNHLASDADTGYAAIAAGGCFSAATTDFWGLHQKELLLIQALLRTLPPTSLADVPIFLPFTSPSVPQRLLTASLTVGLDLILLSGQDLTIAKLPTLVHTHFRPISNPLKQAVSQTLNDSLPLDGRIEAAVLVQRNPDCIAAIFTDPNANPGPANYGSVGQGTTRRSFTLAEEARPQADGPTVKNGLVGSATALAALAKLSAFALCSAPLLADPGTATVLRAHPQDVPESAEVTDVQLAVAGHRLAAATEHVGTHTRTLYAALRADLSQAEACTLTRHALVSMPPMVTS